jgi:uncharacterized protein with FMN-binding domain
MNPNRSQPTFNLGQLIKKLFISGFVIFTFVAYVVHQRFTNPDSALIPTPTMASLIDSQSNHSTGSLAAPTDLPTATVQPTDASNQPATPFPTFIVVPTSTAVPPTAVILPTATSNQGLYKDGTYQGPQVDVFYGIVEVRVNVQNGKIADVAFLQYPNDRRTSVRINNIAMPYLQQEALQAQSARINIISGATLTSEGFMMSLDAALKSAQNSS